VEAQSGLHARLVEAGARPERSAVVMGASSGALELLVDTHDVRPVASEDELDAWLGVGENTGFIDGPQARAAYRRVLGTLALAREHPLRLHIAWSGEVAIGAISARRHADVVAIDHLDVREGSRRRGVGRALVSAALAAEGGWAHVVLGPTPSSIVFYERLGFVLQRYPADRSYYLPARPTA
jgi:GNAT superfamily N-acetyltransferase